MMLRRPLSWGASLPFFKRNGISTRPATRLNRFVVPADPGTSFGEKNHPAMIGQRAFKPERRETGVVRSHA